jgi:hypothetical protein
VVVEGPSIEATLAAAEAACRETRSDLAAGELVVPPLLTEELPEAARRQGYPLVLEAPCSFCDFTGICGVALEGRT